MTIAHGYTIGETIFESTSTRVYRATRQSDGQTVVLKTPKLDSQSPSTLVKYRDEFELLQSIRSDLVIQAYAVDLNALTPVLVLEDYTGSTSLLSRLNNYCWPSPQMLRLSLHLAGGLDVIHSNRIVHKDVNPSNTLVHSTSHEIKIIDLGLASRFGATEPGFQSPLVLEGTLAYISPEQTGRANRSVDERSDLYSLGVTFYHLASGQLPFQLTDPLELIYAHLARKPVPLHELIPDFPELLSQIVMKLLEKSPEQRYQSASGLKHDLEWVHRQWHGPGQLESFVIGQHDRGRHFRIVETLYGREREIAALGDALTKACNGRPRLLLIDGASGTGKTSVVQETFVQLTRRKGYFIRGKFDQFKRDTPFSALVQAFQELIRQWLTEPETILSRTKERVREAVGRNGAVITEFLSEMKWILGESEPVPEVGPVEAQNRFNNVFRNFIAACATRERPLVLFLDDLQWADHATLELIRTVLSRDEGDIALLIVGSYRTHEVNEAHPLMAMKHALERVQSPIDNITVLPLKVGHIEEMLRDTLLWSPAECQEPAQLLWERTHGNPFFLHQFIALIHQKGGLAFDDHLQRWIWNPDIVREQAATGDVVDLLLERMRSLSASSQTALGIAACVGGRFSLAALALALGRSVADTTHDLADCFSEGLLIRTRTISRFRAGDEAPFEGDMLRFVHDRVQQASYQLIPDEQRKVTHLQIGRRMLEGIAADALDGQLFDIVDHYEVALPLLTEPAERLRIAELFYRTGVRAKRGTAYHPGVRYLKAALTLLPTTMWKGHYRLTMGIHRELNECAYLAGDVVASDAMGDAAITHAQNDLDRIPVYVIRVNRLVASHNLTEAIDVALHALVPLGITIRRERNILRLIYSFIKVHLLYRNATVDSVLQAQTMTEPSALASMRLLTAILLPSYLVGNLRVFAMCVLTPLLLANRFGHMSVTRSSFGGLGIFFNLMGWYRRGRAYMDLSLQLAERYPDAYQDCVLHFGFGSATVHWLSPAREALTHLDLAYRLGLESGNHAYAGYAVFNYVLVKQFLGVSLTELLTHNRKAHAFFLQSPNKIYELSVDAINLCIGLATETDSVVIRDLETKLDGFLDTAIPAARPVVARNAALVYLLFGSRRTARWLAAHTEQTYRLGYAGLAGEATHFVYHTMLLVDDYPAQSWFQKRATRRLLKRNEKKMVGWAKNSPENFLHYLYIIQAEVAAIRGDVMEAIQCYDAAIKAGLEYGYLLDIGLANDRAGKLCIANDLVQFSERYMLEAHRAYARWGATRKTHELERSFSYLRDASVPTRSSGVVMSTLRSTTGRVDQLDITTMMRASQALAGERELEHLLERLMKMVLENAGAQRGSLLLNQKEQLRVVATFDADRVTVGLDHPPEEQPIANSVVHFVTRTLEPVVVDDARVDSRFQEDPHIRDHRVLSLLCMALTHQGRLTGILYLEHNEMRRTFSPERIAFLDVIASQAAIAVENALLYMEIRATNLSLEAQVVERTRTLERTLADLWGEMDLAKKIQTVLLPLDGSHGGYSIAATMTPADQVGGDYYDIIPVGDRTWVLIGDVSGHGITAGLIMMMVQTSIRTVLSESPAISPSKLISRVNRSVIRNLDKIGRNDYMTIQAFCFESAQVTYAGLHQDVLIHRAASRTVEMHTDLSGMWLGMIDDIETSCVDQTLAIEPGDSVLMFTDGITEIRKGGELLESSGLAALFERETNAGLTGAALIAALLAITDGVQVQDDVTLVVVQHT